MAYAKQSPALKAVEERALRAAAREGLEVVEVTLQKESRGKCLCVYIDKPGGVTLDDCERYHKLLQPLLEDVDYDIMEVSSPGADRPLKTPRDVEKNLGREVEVRLFAKSRGAKMHRGRLVEMNDDRVVIETAGGETVVFERKGVALVKPYIDLDDEKALSEDEE